MATLIANSFASYILTEEEELQGTILTTAQRQVFQNHLSNIAEEKLGLDFDPDPAKVLSYVQQEAYKKGQMELLQYILSNSDIATDETLQIALTDSYTDT